MTSIPQIGDTISTTIESLAYGNGAGVARIEGFVVFIPNAAPGDQVSAKVTAVKRNFAEAQIIKIENPSIYRVTPPCPVAPECGGCSWQHVNYEEQLNQKQQIVEKAFTQLVESPQEQLLKIIPSEKPLNYRNRIQLQKRGCNWGYFKKNSTDIVPIQQCYIADNQLNELLVKLRDDSSLPKNARVELLLQPDGSAIHQIISKERDALGFSQINSQINQILIEKVLQTIRFQPVQNIFDLYSGNGNFSFPIAENFPNSRVFSVELNTRAHQDAKQHLLKNPQFNLQLIHSSVETFLKSHLAQKTDVILIDPPRAGLQKKARELLIQQDCRTLLYISCDPMTLRRDLTSFTNAGNFKLQWIQPLDMFPQTPHMEILACLNRA